ncbi:hypothetical protein V8C42DRAFT_314685, partial [Trichoderma barbatum]
MGGRELFFFSLTFGYIYKDEGGCVVRLMVFRVSLVGLVFLWNERVWVLLYVSCETTHLSLFLFLILCYTGFDHPLTSETPKKKT